MNVILLFERIEKLFETDESIEVKKIKGGSFTASLHQSFIKIEELSSGGFPLAVFQDALYLLRESETGEAKYGIVKKRGIRLGDEGLDLSPLDGHIAYYVFGTKFGTAVLQRSYYVGAILVAAGLCEWIPAGIRLVRT